MATKAEHFRYFSQREKPIAARSTKPGRSASGKGVGKINRRDTDDAGARNLSKHGQRKAAVTTEESHSGQPSRKSTRRAANGGKNSTMLEHAARAKTMTPQARHARQSRVGKARGLS